MFLSSKKTLLFHLLVVTPLISLTAIVIAVNILLYSCMSLPSQNRRSLKVALVYCYYDRVER